MGPSLGSGTSQGNFPKVLDGPKDPPGVLGLFRALPEVRYGLGTLGEFGDGSWPPSGRSGTG